MRLSGLLLLAVLATRSVARDIPDNVQALYNSIRIRGECKKKLASGFYAKAGGPNSFSYCGDRLKDLGIIYLQGKNGELLDMDVDCDGQQGGVGDDGRCLASTDTQNQTTFVETLNGYGQSVTELNANVHPYVVFGNQGSQRGYKTFDPQKYDIKPLSVMAVVCNGRLIYGVWGDTNGDDGPQSMVGEASISMATACYGRDSVTGNSSPDVNDVLYIAFRGNEAVPGPSAAWAATDFDEFERSIAPIGDSLISRLSAGVPLRTSIFVLVLQCTVAALLVL